MSESVATAHSAAGEDSSVDREGGIAGLIRSLENQVSEVESEWREEVTREVFDSLRRVTEELIAAHAAAGEKLQGDFEGREDLRTAIREYRREIAEDVIGKLGRYLRSTPPEERATVALFSLLDSLAGMVSSFPETMSASSEWDPYRTQPFDGFITRLRKAVLRVVRRMRGGKGSRQVPVRLVAAYHLEVRMARRFVSRHKECIRRLCAVASDLEESFSQWTHAALDIEENIDAPAFYAPSDFDVELAADSHSVSATDAAAEIMAVDSDLGAGLQRMFSGLQFEVPEDPHADAALLLETDLQYAGTFLLKAKDRAVPSEAYMPASLVEEDQRPLIDWLESARNRMRINWHLLNLRAVLVSQVESLSERAANQTVRPLLEVMEFLKEHLAEVKRRLDATFDPAADDRPADSILADLDGFRQDVDAIVGEVTGRVSAFDEGSDFLKDFGNTGSEAVARAFGQLPGPVQIRVSEATQTAVRLGLAEYETVDLKSIANRMLGLRYSDQVRRHSDKLRRAVTRRWIDVEQAAEVVRFGLTAARDELELGSDAGDEDRSESNLHQAYELASEGFVRAIEMAETDSDGLESTWSEFVHGVAGISLEDWSVLHRQVLGAEMADEWTGYRDRIRRGVKALESDIRRLATVIAQKSELFFRLGRRHAHSLIQRGQSVVGVGQAVRGKRLETIDAIGRWGELMLSLPLVYRRLFSFEPLSDVSHMVNRTADLTVVRNHFERWRNGRSTNSMLLSTSNGSGRTSFLNVLEHSVFSDADVRRLALAERYESEFVLAGDLARVLDISLDGEPSFQSLETELLGLKKTRRPIVFMVDNIDHVLLRLPGGSRLLESLLIFFSRTDEAVYWIATINNLARHFLEKSLQIGGFVDFYGLDPFDREATQSMLLSRHRKSGLQLRFEAPEEIGAIMKQRLRRAKSEADRQSILSSAFFEKLHKESGQNLRLALFYWLRSIDFETSSDAITVRSVRNLSVDFLAELDLRSAFTLRAMLFHSTLTLDEHNRLFRMSDREGTMIMESLLNSGLIVPIGKKGFEVQARVEADARYRVHPLLVHPIVEHLRGRHIVY